jgi:hypothetical protein
MNGLSNNIYPYSLNNLQTITTSDGGGLPVSANAPIIKTTTATNQNLFLYESATDLIDFNTYNKSLRVKDLIANTGTFSAVYSTGARFFSLNATGVNVDTLSATTSIFSSASLNAPNAFIDCNGINSIGSNPIRTTFGFTGPFITAGSGTFQNVNTNVLTANTINISSLNIPNLQYTVATGGYLTSTGTITSRQSLRTTNGNINTFDFTDISSNGDTSIYNAGGALQTSFQFDGSERMKLSSAGKLDVSFLQSSGAFTGTSVATTSTIFSGGVLSTTSGRIANGSSAWTTNGNDYFINANNETVYFRPKGETATPADAQAFLTNAGNFTISTGTLSAFNGTFSGGLSATNANISAFALTASSFVRAPYFTGAKVDTNFLTFSTATGSNLTSTNISFSTATGGTVRSNLVVRNPQTLQFNQLNDTQIVRIEAGGASNVLSYYDASNVLQETYTTSSSGANIDFINQMGVRDLTATGRVFNGNGNQTTPSYTFVNDTNTGFYRIGEDNIALSLGNRRNMNFTQGTITMGSGANNGVDLNLQGTLQVGGTNNSSSALINLGFSGSAGAIANFRQGYLFMDGSNMFLNNQQFDNVPLLQNSSKGSIILDPGNGTYRFVLRPSGQITSTSRVDSDAAFTISNSTTGAGYGLYINKPNDGANGNNYYSLVIQGTSNTSAITMHPQVSNLMSNITLGRTNYPFSNDALTVRPYSLASQDTFMLISQHYLENNGKVYIGQNGTGSTRPSDAFIQNHSSNVGSKRSGIYFQTDTATYGVSCPAQYIDYTGQTFFNPFTNRSIDTPTNSQTGSTLSVVYGFKSLPQVGTVYTMSRGAGKYIPWVKADANNANYTVAGGVQKIALTDATTVNASPWQTPAGARQYSFRTDFEGLYDIKWNLNIFALATTAYYVYVYKNGVVQSTSIGDVSRAGTFSFCNGSTLVQCNAGDDIDMRIQADTNTITVGNNSTIQAIYMG